jgi:hypothetical protein
VPLHGHGVHTGGDRGSHESDRVELVLPHSVIRPGSGESHRLPDGVKEVQVEAGLGAELSIGLRRQPTEAVPERGVEEVEGKLTAPNGRTDRLHWDPTLLEPLNEADPPKVPAGERRVALAWGNDAELDEPVDELGRHPRSLGELLTGESAHDLAMVVAKRLGREC